MQDLTDEKADIDESDAREIVRLLGDLAVSDAALAQKRMSLMKGLCRLIDADAWIRISLGRGEPGELPTFSVLLKDGFTEQQFANFLKAQEHEDMKEINRPFLEEYAAKKTHITRLRQQVDQEGRFPRSDAYSLWREADVAPLILSYRPISGERMSGTVLFRRFDRELFTARESRIAHILLSEVPWLHEDTWPTQTAALHISPRQNTVLNLLLQGIGRKVIADRLDLSIHTVNDYIKDIYLRFGVHSQAELIHRFVEGDGGDIS